MELLAAEVAPQPRLPAKMPGGDLWPAQTRAWWQAWGASPLTDRFTEVEWRELLVAAVLHGRFWSGDMKVAAELRLRVAKFGATAEDRARLRVEFDFDDAEPAPPPTSRANVLRLVDEGGS